LSKVLADTGQLPPVELFDVSIDTVVQLLFQLLSAQARSLSFT
jgi:hypothetical protein